MNALSVRPAYARRSQRQRFARASVNKGRLHNALAVSASRLCPRARPLAFGQFSGLAHVVGHDQVFHWHFLLYDFLCNMPFPGRGPAPDRWQGDSRLHNGRQVWTS